MKREKKIDLKKLEVQLATVLAVTLSIANSSYLIFASLAFRIMGSKSLHSSIFLLLLGLTSLSLRFFKMTGVQYIM